MRVKHNLFSGRFFALFKGYNAAERVDCVFAAVFYFIYNIVSYRRFVTRNSAESAQLL